MGKRGPTSSSQSVCPYCHEPFKTQPELVEHLTQHGGCPKAAPPVNVRVEIGPADSSGKLPDGVTVVLAVDCAFVHIDDDGVAVWDVLLPDGLVAAAAANGLAVCGLMVDKLPAKTALRVPMLVQHIQPHNGPNPPAR